jgi:hypothetical protein
MCVAFAANIYASINMSQHNGMDFIKNVVGLELD